MSQQSDYYRLHETGLKLKALYSIIGLFLGLACVLSGVVLGLHGVAGHTSWTASLLGFSTNLNDAAPGVILFVVGIFIVLITGFKVKASEILHPSPIREEPAKQSTEAVARTTDKDQNDPPPRQSNEGGGASFTSPGTSRPAGSRET